MCDDNGDDDVLFNLKTLKPPCCVEDPLKTNLGSEIPMTFYDNRELFTGTVIFLSDSVCVKSMKEAYIFCDPIVPSDFLRFQDLRHRSCFLNMLLTSTGPDKPSGTISPTYCPQPQMK